mgnify:CR=1 FL=1|tara:strand:- start:515 stop:1657 length:1143 start_codon:yes stop_codon:yes gene_type:complete
MVDENFLSIIDFGSSKLRLGVFNTTSPNSNYISESLCKNSLKSNDLIIDRNNDVIHETILKTEKALNQHIKDIIVMVDTIDSISVDFSVKKKIDKSYIIKQVLKNIIQEAKTTIEKNYHTYKIQHLIILKYISGNMEYNEMPENNLNDHLIIDFKFILIPKIIIEKIKDFFKQKHISITNIYNSSYLKSLDCLKNFDLFDIKAFIDIGYNKTSFLIFKKNKLIYFNVFPIGGNHITKDISAVLQIELDESEKQKKLLKHTNANLSSHKANDLLIKVIHARVEEIIDLCFKSLNFYKDLKDLKSILIFTGEGSKILSKNSIYLKEEYNFFNEMNFFEENSNIICNAGFDYALSDKLNEVTIIPKKQKKRGFFEKFFYFFNK